MSPHSPKKRKSNQCFEKAYLRKLLKKMRPTDIELDDSQSSETALIGGIIETQHKDALEEIINEASEYSAINKETLQQIWDIDMAERKMFFESQKKNTSDYRGNRMNMITYRVALAIYIRSPSAYRDLKSFQIKFAITKIFTKIHFR